MASLGGRSLGEQSGCKHRGGRSTVDALCTHCQIHSQTRGRLCHFPEPDLGKALPIPMSLRYGYGHVHVNYYTFTQDFICFPQLTGLFFT